MSNTPILGAPELAPSQAIPETTVNEAVRFLEQGAGWFRILDRDLSSPPGSPSDGDCYLVATSATGDWSGHDDEIAFYMSSAWVFITPSEGMGAYIADEDVAVIFDGADWNAIGGSPPSIPFTIGTGFEETPTASYVIARYTFVEDIDFADDFAGAQGNIEADPADGDFVIDVAVNGSPVGTITISTSGVFTFATTGGALSCLTGDEMLITAPSTPDSTAAGCSFTLKGTRP